GTGEGFREEDRLGIACAYLRDQPLPERQRLRVRVVDAEYLDAVPEPEEHDVAQRLPQRGPGIGFEVEGVDVLVALGRVFRVLDRSVRTLPEPFGMLVDPWMVRRALEGDVECHAEPALLRLGDEGVEVRELPEVGVHRGVSALGCADGPWTPRIARLGNQRVVAALAVRRADGMDGRQIQHVEAHASDVVETVREIAEGAGARGIG